VRLRPGGVLLPSVAFVAILAVGGGGAALALTRAGAPARPAPTAPAAPVPQPQLSVVGAVHGRVPWSAPLQVAVTHGELVAVAAVAADSPSAAPAPGSFDPAQDRWTSAGHLVPATTYRIGILYADLARRLARTSITVTTTAPTAYFHAVLSPDGGVFGVGQPAIITFDHPLSPAEQRVVQAHLTVTTSPAVAGAWHWMSPAEVHWRPQQFWQPGTVVTVTSDLSDVEIAGGLWGNGRHTVTFRIGPSHVSIADIARHVFRVYQNGVLIRTIPMSAGRPKYPTKAGIHITLEKDQVVRMDSATVGIPVNSPDGYDELVYWDVRISDSGEFVHAAPWSVAQQGVVNVSHGCINLAPAAAEWFYGFSQVGDVVEVVDGGAPTDVYDPGMADWNLSWPQWVAG
jgi:lipoprotein-anchoring transpeptidase ErfK/SrfK